MSDVSDKVRAIAADVFDVDVDEINESSTADDIESWDSLATLNLMVALEDEFGMQLSPDAMADAATIGSIVALVAEQVGA